MGISIKEKFNGGFFLYIRVDGSKGSYRCGF